MSDFILTDKFKHRTLGHMLRFLLFITLSLFLESCAAKPPVQAMAEARAAVQSVRPLYEGVDVKKGKSYEYYQSAESALLEASNALNAKQYGTAKLKAKQAKLKARMAARTERTK
ncbi:MAG: hypothetical protein R8M14_04870 [Ghiorsea sp.]